MASTNSPGPNHPVYCDIAFITSLGQLWSHLDCLVLVLNLVLLLNSFSPILALEKTITLVLVNYNLSNVCPKSILVPKN